MVSEMVRIWAAGWSVSRRTPWPAERPWGLYIDVGLPEQAGRHVVPDADRAAVTAAAGAVTRPHTWLKVPADPDDVATWLTPGWRVDEEDFGYLMTVDLRTTEPVPPRGYAATLWTEHGVTHVEVTDANGDTAAKAQMAVLGRAAVVDRVATEPAHRRRGLGGYVMRALADHAVARGAGVGVLGATDAGRALYRTLGWKQRAPLTACVLEPAA